ncbi:hypothetical protein Q9251_01640 [Alkalihalobacillus macyae]|uniref:hypothetical protein n=1 Tax=Guptibacillus hwajinpoensis TaxID=208199 RepID=UPI00273A7DBD|nr:hypothetical protein [Alkalihalobacillus macyae]MDP4549580.1 hypothetical protein [Alkalihalobacillus macyae]
MKTYLVLFIIVAIMHTMTFINIAIFNGEWNGIVMFLSTALFIIAVFYFSTEYRANKYRGYRSNT